MFTITLTLSLEFLATTRALSAELPQVRINTNPVQEIVFQPEVSETEVFHWVKNYIDSGRYDKVELSYK